MNQILILIITILIFIVLYKSTITKENWDSYGLHRIWWFHMDHDKINNLKHINHERGKMTETNGEPVEKFCKIDGSDYKGDMSRTISGASCVGTTGLFDTNDANKKYSNGKCRLDSDSEPTFIGKYGIRPFCKVNQDRFGALWKYHKDTKFFGGDEINSNNNKCEGPGRFYGYHKWKTRKNWRSRRVNHQEFRKPHYYKDYDSYNTLKGRKDQWTMIDHKSSTGAQKCWVGTPSYRKWDCVDYENIPNSDSIWGKHGVTRTRESGYIINGGTYEKITKITTSGIMGSKNWKESCWTKEGDNQYRNFAIDHFPTKVDKYSTYILPLPYVNTNLFDSTKIYGIDIIGQTESLPWSQEDCEYGNNEPITDKTWYRDDKPEPFKNNWMGIEPSHVDQHCKAKGRIHTSRENGTTWQDFQGTYLAGQDKLNKRGTFKNGTSLNKDYLEGIT
ncbi:hypothetical protein N9T73_00145 [bacterium]|nr:hypothetical protein [bacterium]